MPWLRGRAARVTGADWRPGHLLVRSYDGLWEACAPQDGPAFTMGALVSAPWHRIDSLPAHKGEAVAFAPDGVWHVFEGKGARLVFLPRTKAEVTP